MSEKITLQMTTRVLGPNGQRLPANSIVELDDSPYVRGLVSGGHAELIDPPSFDYIDKKDEIQKRAEKSIKELENGSFVKDPEDSEVKDSEESVTQNSYLRM